MASDEQRFQVSGSAAGLYERWPVRAVFEGWAEDLVERVDVGPGDDVLDVACGTGVVSRAAARRVGTGSVTGVDLNEPMISAATELAPADSAISFRVADAERLPFDDGSFDVAVCQQGLQFVPDRSRAVSEMHRVLRPSGRVAVSTWRDVGENPYFVALADGLDEHLGPGSDVMMTAACSLADSGELRSFFEAVGFRDVEVEPAERLGAPMPAAELVLGNLNATPLAATLAEMPDEAVTAMVATILDRVSDDVDAQGRIRILTRTNILTAAKA